MPPEEIVQHYCAATRGQEQSVHASSMDVEIKASLPKLKKQGKLHALRHVSAIGRITYDILGFDGDSTVKKQVINRYLNAESEVQQNAFVAVTPDNYRFNYKGTVQLDGRETHLFEVTPKHKSQGLFRGELWIDAVTFLRVQESGYLVKSPSIALKKAAFVRKYEIRDGISVPRQEQSVVDTRLGLGKVEMTIDFKNFALDGAPNGTPK